MILKNELTLVCLVLLVFWKNSSLSMFRKEATSLPRLFFWANFLTSLRAATTSAHGISSSKSSSSLSTTSALLSQWSKRKRNPWRNRKRKKERRSSFNFSFKTKTWTKIFVQNEKLNEDLRSFFRSERKIERRSSFYFSFYFFSTPGTGGCLLSSNSTCRPSRIFVLDFILPQSTANPSSWGFPLM